MKVDCRPYKASLDKLTHMMTEKTDPRREIGFVAAASYVPAIVVCAYMLRYVYPNHPDLKNAYEELKSFYKYVEVIQFDT